MSQYDPGTVDPNTTDGAELATLITSWAAALRTNHSGASAPSYATAGTTWLDTAVSTAFALKIYTGSVWLTVYTFNPASGAAMGNKLRRVRLFTASATYTPTDSSVRAIRVRCIGGGAGGGGAAVATSSQAAAGGGGASGSEGEGLITNPALFASVAMTIGAGGAGGVGTGAAGAGGATSFGSLISAPGGTGGGSSNASGSGAATFGGGAGVAGAAPTFDAAVQQIYSKPGMNGHFGLRLSTDAVGGNGGASTMGNGGRGTTGSNSGGGNNGASAVGYGGGGGGAGNSNDSAKNGGAGGAGIIIVWEMD